MPIFEYECAKCQKVFEVLTTGIGGPRLKCPRCSSVRLKKLVSGFAVLSGGSRTTSQAKSGSSCVGCGSKKCSTCR